MTRPPPRPPAGHATRPAPRGQGPAGRGRQALTGLAALGLLVVLLGGVPWALVAYIGWPLPHTVPTWTGLRAGLTAGTIPTRVLLDALAVAVWAGWAVLAAALATETAAAVRGRPTVRVRPAGPLQPLAAALIGAVALAVLAVLPRPAPAFPVPLAAGLALRPASAAASTAASTKIGTAVPPRTHDEGAIIAAAQPHPAATNASNPATRPYVVARRDTLWGIADRQLGDPLRWSQIYALNCGRAMPDGRTFDDPNRIWPGWTLLLPTGDPTVVSPAGPPSDTRPAVPDQQPAAATPTGASLTRPPVPTAAPVRTPARPSAAATPRVVTGGPVELPSGSVIGGSFAAGLAAALLLGRLRRRHGYRPRPPEPGRRVAPPDLGPTVRRLAATAQPSDDENEEPGAPDGPAVDGPGPLLASDDPDRRERPDLIEIGTRDGAAAGAETVSMALTDLAGAALTGPRADDTARAWLAAVLVRAGPLAAEILITTAARDRLLPGLPDVPGLRVIADPNIVLRQLELQVLGRTRQLDDTATDTDGLNASAGGGGRDTTNLDIVGYRHAHPCEPLPTLIAVLDALPPEQTGRWQTTLAAGRRVGLGALILAPTSAAGTRIDVPADRTPTIDAPTDIASRLAGVRLFGLTAAETVEVLAALADTERRPASDDPDDPVGGRDTRGDAYGQAVPGQLHAQQNGARPCSGPADEPAAVPGPEATGRPQPDEPSAADASPAATAAGPACPNDLAPPLPLAPPRTAGRIPAGAVSAPTRKPASAATGSGPGVPLVVRVFGPVTVRAWGRDVQTGLRDSARELLVWFLLHPDGAPAAAAIDALWPDAAPERGSQRFWTALGNLRSRLRGPDGQHLDVLAKTGEVYCPQSGGLDVDLWRFQDALAGAARDDTVTRDALAAAVDLYRGDLAGTARYGWIEPVREELHRRALDAHVRLAELHDETGDTDAAIEVLERAIKLDPVAEELYRRLMRLLGRAGDRDRVNRVWAQLQGRLADIDVDPDPATVALVGKIRRPATARTPSFPS